MCEIEEMTAEEVEKELILAYVPESEHLTHGEALHLAIYRDMAAALSLMADCGVVG